MGTYKEVKGDLISLALAGEFDCIAHGVNCQCIQGSGLAPQMVKHFYTHNFPLEMKKYKGDINKLGQIDYETDYLEDDEGYTTNNKLTIINAYTQFEPGVNNVDIYDNPLDYTALEMCLKKINYLFKGKTIGLPMLGAGLARGNWNIIKESIKHQLRDMNVIVVIYNKN